jgi:hypothetical protein
MSLHDPLATLALHKLFDNLSTFSPYLRTLTLHIPVQYDDNIESNVTADNGLFTRHFPFLDTLSLRGCTVERPELASEFWFRHQNLERLELHDVGCRWFDKSSITFPRLRVFKVRQTCLFYPHPNEHIPLGKL